MKQVARMLEYEKMKTQLQEHVSSPLGKEKVTLLKPSIHFDEVKKWQQETAEALTVLRLKGNVPLGTIVNIQAYVKRAEIGGALSAHELISIAHTIHSGRRLKNFIDAFLEVDVQLPLLYGYVEQIDPLQTVEKNITTCIDDHGAIVDDASSALRTVRHQIRSYEAAIRSKLERIIRSTNTQKMLSDQVVTIRNDRFVIPVKQEYRHTFGGIVHDQSASGQTLFIEPETIVRLNNDLKEATVKEEREMERILAELSAIVAEVAAELLQNVDVLGQLDFIFAKAHYAKELKASKPRLNDKGYILLKEARHPLLHPEEVVPIHVELGGAYRSLIITGPNTGGKTVTLKTVGLLTLMAQSGLHLPVDEDSEVAVFKRVFADIGDEQSIEQSLSTFSSHMTNIIAILEKMDAESLVLVDELGAGTDPTEGAALAISILDYMYEKGARIIATTHYSELKAYAYNREGVINGSVEFDIETLQPTYRLLIGVPGRSNAFAISSRLGLQKRIIYEAKSHIDSETNRMENMIAALESNRKTAEAAWEEAEKFRLEAETLRNELAEAYESFEREKDQMLQEAEEEAANAVTNAMKEAEQIITDLRKMQQEGLQVKDHKLIEAKKQLEEAKPTFTYSKKEAKQPIKKTHTIGAGDEVNVLSLKQKGFITEQLNDDEYEVQIGILKMKVNRNDLQLVSRAKEVETKPLTTIRGKDYHVNTELDLRGERFDDAMRRVEKYLDDALLAGHSEVSIIHGKGSGALRRGVKQLLKKHPRVKSERDGGMHEGGIGNTVVQLK